MIPQLTVRVTNPFTGLDRAWVFQEVQVARFPDNLNMKVVGFSAVRTGHIYPEEIFLVLISVRAWNRTQGHSAAGRINSMKNPNDTNRNRTLTFQFVAQGLNQLRHHVTVLMYGIKPPCGSRGTVPLILNLRTRGVSAQVYAVDDAHTGKCPWYSMNGRLCGPHSKYGSLKKR